MNTAAAGVSKLREEGSDMATLMGHGDGFVHGGSQRSQLGHVGCKRDLRMFHERRGQSHDV